MIYDLPTPDGFGLPDAQLDAEGRLKPAQLATVRNMRYILESVDIRCRLDVMSAQRRYDSPGKTHPDPRDDAEADYLENELLDVCTRLNIRSREVMREHIAALANLDRYHPMEEWLNGLDEWNEGDHDHIGDLVASITTETPLADVLIRKWLIQCIESVCGWRDADDRSIPHVLVLAGGQGVGKTHWLRNLGGQWILNEAELHLNTAGSKDHQITALKYPIVELSELDGIFRKSDMSHMKSFISRSTDSLRAPYERKALVRPRMTSFAGSVNDTNYLTDDTGSRRFWTIMVDAIDWDADVDMAGVWSQAFTLWLSEVPFHLSEEEEKVRAENAEENHTAQSQIADTINGYLDVHTGHPAHTPAPMNVTEVMEMLFGAHSRHSPRDLSEARKVLEKRIGKARKVSGKQRCWMIPYSQGADNKDRWPKKSGSITTLSLVPDTAEPPEDKG
jgi:putative DNA primase/helicase